MRAPVAVVAAILAAGLAVAAPAVGDPELNALDPGSPAMEELRTWPTPPNVVQTKKGDYPPFSFLKFKVASSTLQEVSEWAKSQFPIGEPFNGIPYCSAVITEFQSAWLWSSVARQPSSLVKIIYYSPNVTSDPGVYAEYYQYPAGSSATDGCHTSE